MKPIEMVLNAMTGTNALRDLLIKNERNLINSKYEENKE